MGKAVDLLSVFLLVAALASFSFGVLALSEQKDLQSVYWLVVGGLLLKAAVDLLRPKRSV